MTVQPRRARRADANQTALVAALAALPFVPAALDKLAALAPAPVPLLQRWNGFGAFRPRVPMTSFEAYIAEASDEIRRSFEKEIDLWISERKP